MTMMTIIDLGVVLVALVVMVIVTMVSVLVIKTGCWRVLLVYHTS